MKRILFLIISFACHTAFCQETDLPANVQGMESLADRDDIEPEDDSYLQLLERYLKEPLNLNNANEDDLMDLHILNAMQVQHFISYRKIFGQLLNIYELQAIPLWDLPTIMRLLPYVIVKDGSPLNEDLKRRLRSGEYHLMLRWGRTMESSKGFIIDSTGKTYLGDPWKIFLRLKYQCKNLLQYGITGDKDAGERFLKWPQKNGFDFYSFHLFLRNVHSIRNLALGDFTVNMGQGLIHWQSGAFGKTNEMTLIKRQAPVIKPYTSAAEFNFHRGVGVTLAKASLEATAFISLRNLSGNRVSDSSGIHFSSINNSGYHRTYGEIEDRNKLSQLCFGSNINLKFNNLRLGLNSIHYKFNYPIIKRDEPYNLFAFRGDRWYNMSLDYSFTFRNLHLFGEIATDGKWNKAIITGLLISVDHRADVSLLYRNIDKAFQSFNGNALTENTSPTNERGFYTSISMRPVSFMRIDGYADIYYFPWLKFNTDSPSRGRDLQVQLSYEPLKLIEVYSRFRNEIKHYNSSFNSAIYFPVNITRKSWRTHLGIKINPSLTMRTRVEILWIKNNGTFPGGGKKLTRGYLNFIDLIYKPMMKPYSGNIRLQYFETDGYDARIYAYENDVLYFSSIPPFYGKGFRYYINLHYRFGSTSFWLKWSQTHYKELTVIGSGPDEISGSKRSELRLLTRIIF